MFSDDPAQEKSAIPPDKNNSSTVDKETTVRLKPTSKISSSGKSRVSKKPCKYIRAKQVCPFGRGCHFSHDISETHTPLSDSREEADARHSDLTDRQSRNRRHPARSRHHGQHTTTTEGTVPKAQTPVDTSPTHTVDTQHSNRQRKDRFYRRKHPHSEHSHYQERYRRHPPTHMQNQHTKHAAVDSDPVDLVSEHEFEKKIQLEHPKITPLTEESTVKASPNNGQSSKTKAPRSAQVPERQTGSKKPKQGPSELNLGSFLTPSLTRPPVQRPKPKKAAKATTLELRQVELEQFEMRFPDCVLLEKGREKSVYSFSYRPADPEWDFPFKSLSFEVTFPGDYPLTPLKVRIQKLDTFTNDALDRINSHLEQHLASDAFESGTLMFRPFIHWIDRSIVAILRDSMPKEEPGQDVDEEAQEFDSEDEDTESDEDSSGEIEVEDGSGSSFVAPPKAGTEIRLVGLNLSMSVATVTFSTPKVVVVCGRCKQQEDIKAKPESAVGGCCSRCQTVFTVVYHPALVHATSSTVGYLDMIGCTPADLVLLDCAMTMVCLECNYGNEMKTMMFGQGKDFWCRKCHCKLSINAQQCRFIKHQATGNIKVSEESRTALAKAARSKEPQFKLGHPLPDSGVCAHYKKSHRWFRFPCCGKAYPCDVCHDSNETHVMERANRMICGYCSLEQVYSSTKPCSGCGSDLSSSRHSSYWEGGKGCRNKTKMNRRDKRKYANSAQKTSSQKSKRVGRQENS